MGLVVLDDDESFVFFFFEINWVDYEDVDL